MVKKIGLRSRHPYNYGVLTFPAKLWGQHVTGVITIGFLHFQLSHFGPTFHGVGTQMGRLTSFLLTDRAITLNFALLFEVCLSPSLNDLMNFPFCALMFPL
jgi:hypothetical protein